MTVARLGVAIVGLGRWGTLVAKAFSTDPRCEIRSLCDTDRRRLAEAAALWPQALATTSFEAAIRHPGIDAVSICTPASTHASLAIEAIVASRHVLVEKPMALSLADAEELVHAADSRGVRLMTGHVYAFHPASAAFQALIASKALGRVRSLKSTRLNAGPLRPDTCALWDLAPHDLGLFRAWLDACPVQWEALVLREGRPGKPDEALATLRYAAGIEAELHVGWSHHEKVRRLEARGDDGEAIYDEKEAPDRIEIHRLGRDYAIRLSRRVTPLERLCRAFVGWCLGGKTPLATGREILPVIASLERLSRSLSPDRGPARGEAAGLSERPTPSGPPSSACPFSGT